MKIISALSASDKVGGAELIYKISCQYLKFDRVIVNKKIEPQLGISGATPFNFRIISRSLPALLKFLGNYPLLIIKLNKDLKNSNAIYVNDFQGLVYLVCLRIFQKQIRIFYHCHTAFKNNFLNREILSRFINWMTDVILVPSGYLKAELLGIGIRHAVILHNGIPAPKRSSRTYNKVGYESVCQIGILGAISDQKGQDIFVSAIELLLQKNELKLKGHIAGYILDEPFAKLVLRKVSEKTEHFVYHGSLSHEQSLQLINELDIVICASKYRETLPTVLLEAMSFGKPLIGTRVGGIPEVIEPARNGTLIPPNRPDALAAAIEEIVSKNLFHQYSKESYEIFYAKFSLERYVGQMHAILNE